MYLLRKFGFQKRIKLQTVTLEMLLTPVLLKLRTAVLKLFCRDATNGECRAYLKDCDNSLFEILVQYFVGYFVILWGTFNTHDVSESILLSSSGYAMPLSFTLLCFRPVYPALIQTVECKGKCHNTRTCRRKWWQIPKRRAY